jgi:diguanylate cyclase (GGDEF)-like protein
VLFVLTGPQLGVVFALESPQIIIGRDTDADAHLTDDTVSLRHAVVTRGDDGVQIEDYGSRSGTFVNGQRLAGSRPLRDGDRVRVGTFNILKFAMMDELEQRALATLSELSLQDPLTRLYNRRYFDKRLRSELSFAARNGTQMAVLMIDIDHFKQVNDTHGHRMGDLVLKLVARTIERLMRPEDVLARLGGDEFFVIARATSLRNVEILGQRICQRVAAACPARYRHRGSLRAGPDRQCRRGHVPRKGGREKSCGCLPGGPR